MASTHLQRIIKTLPRGGDYFGSTVIFSGDGSKLIIVAPGFGGGVFEYLPTISYYVLLNGQWNYVYDVELPNDLREADHAATYAQLNYDGSLLVFNAQDYNSTPNFNGALFVYSLGATASTFLKKMRISPRIKPISGNLTNQFSFHFAMSNDGNTIVASAPWDLDVDQVTPIGGVYVLETTNNWHNFTYVELYNSQKWTNSGLNVAISGNGKTVYAGALHSDSSGRVTVWEKPTTGWPDYTDSVLETITLNASDVAAGDYFGFANHAFLPDDKAGCAIAANYDGSIFVVGAYQAESAEIAIRGGKSYVFKRTVGGFLESQQLEPLGGTPGSPGNSLSFGWSVSISDIGNMIVIGAQAQDVDFVQDVGVNYIYQDINGTYVEIEENYALNKLAYSYGGYKVHINPMGNYLVSGSVNEQVSGEFEAGAVNIWEIERDTTEINGRTPNYKVLVTEAEANLSASDVQLSDIHSDVNRKYKWPGKKVLDTTDNVIVISQGWYPVDVWWYEDDSLAYTPE